MTKKWFIRIVAIAMALIMAISVLYVVVGSLTATAVTTQSQIDNLKKQQKEIEKKKQEIQAKINSMEYEQKTVLAKKEVLDDQIQLTQDDIGNINEQIETYEQMINTKKLELVQAQKEEENQLELYKVRLRTMEENGTISYISVIFNANSFSDLLARVDFVGEVMEYDNNLYEQLKEAKRVTQEIEQSLEVAKQEQEAEKASLERRQQELEAQQAEADELLNQIKSNIAVAKDLYQQELDAGKQIQSDINKKVEELKKQQQVVGTGKLIWPVPASTRVTSPYGRRFHPIYHEYRMHAGIDVGAGYGKKVLASDDGVVIISTYSSSYGNYIVISHGNGMTTLYAHLSVRNVKANDKVSQGQVIGKIGSTGASTGPHLHYEVSVNGNRKNPLDYFSNYTKAW